MLRKILEILVLNYFGKILKLMKEKNYDIKDIIEITHLTKEEIESL